MSVLLIAGTDLSEDSSTSIFCRIYIEQFCKSYKNVVLITSTKRSGVPSDLQSLGIQKVFQYSPSFLWEGILRSIQERKTSNISDTVGNSVSQNSKPSLFQKKKILLQAYQWFIELLVSSFYPLYRYNSMWLRRASGFQSDEYFDFVISLSHPPASHKLAISLMSKGNIKYAAYIQLWFEPWYQVPKRRNKTNQLIIEERKLLSVPEKVFYINPIFSKNQQSLFPEMRIKMRTLNLPSPLRVYSYRTTSRKSIGFFGDYFTVVRNIKPFFQAALQLPQYDFHIIGRSDVRLETKGAISVRGRIPYKEIQKLEEQMNVLVILSNSNDFQIPGKVYNYATTNKPLLYILDGSEQMREMVLNYFGQYKRFTFCINSPDEIKNALVKILEGKTSVFNQPVEDFFPEKVVESIFK